jgi:adhesin/invasin
VNGTGTVLVRSTVLSGFVSVTGVSGELQSGVAAIEIRPQPAAKISMSSDFNEMIADGSSSITVTAVITDWYNNRITDRQDMITWNIENGTWYDTTTLPKLTTAVNGAATIKVKSTKKTGVIRVSATVGGLQSAQKEINTIGGAASKFVTRVYPARIFADNVSTSVLTVEMIDENGNKVNNYNGFVTRTSVGPIEPNRETKEMVNGTVEFCLKSMKIAGEVRMSVEELISGVTAEIYIKTFAQDVSNVTLISEKSELVSDGQDRTYVEAMVHDLNGNTVDNSTNAVVLSIIAADGTTSNKVLQCVNGTAGVEVKSGITAGMITVTGEVIVGTTSIPAVPLGITVIPQSGQKKLVLTNIAGTELVADGSEMTIRTVLCDFNNNPLGVGNDRIKFVVEGESNLKSGNDTYKILYVLANQGSVDVIVRSTNKVGHSTITAEIENSGVEPSSLSFWTQSGMGTKVVCESDKTVLFADGSSTVTIKAFIKDMNNNIAANYNGIIRFNVSGPGIILTSTAVPVISGEAGIIIRSKVEVGTIVITAICDSISESKINVFTLSSHETQIYAESYPSRIRSGENVVVVIRLADKQGNPVCAERTVILSGTGMFSSKTGTTSLLTGATQVTYTGTVSGEQTITCASAGLNDGVVKITVVPSTQTVEVDIAISTPAYLPGYLNLELVSLDMYKNKVVTDNDSVTLKITNKNNDEVVYSTVTRMIEGVNKMTLFDIRMPGMYIFETSGSGLKIKTKNMPVNFNKNRDTVIQIVTEHGNVRLAISSGTFASDFVMELITGERLRNRSGIIASELSGGNSKLLEQTAVEIVASDNNGYEIPVSLPVDKYLALTIPYPDLDNDGIVDGTGIKEENLKMWYLDKTGWVVQQTQIPQTLSIDVNRNLLTIAVRNTGRYSIMAIATEPVIYNEVVYPNPFSDNTVFGLELAAQTELKVTIYSVTGRIVKTITKQFNESILEGTRKYVNIPYDGTDDTGELISNGLYIYKIVSKSNNKQYVKTGKFTKTK